jgi:hypothetical protein
MKAATHSTFQDELDVAGAGLQGFVKLAAGEEVGPELAHELLEEVGGEPADGAVRCVLYGFKAARRNVQAR